MDKGKEFSKAEVDRILDENEFRELFSNYSDIEKYVDVKRYLPGEYLIESGKSVNHLFYIYNGKALVSPIQEYYASSHIVCEDPWFTGEVNLFKDEEIVSGVMALTECLCVRIAINQDSKEALLDDTTFLREMCRHFAKKSVLEGKKAALYQSYDLTQKVAKYFLDAKLENGKVVFNKTLYANDLGASKRHIQDVVRKLVVGGIIKDISETQGKFGNKPLAYMVIDEASLSDIVAGKKQIGEFA